MNRRESLSIKASNSYNSQKHTNSGIEYGGVLPVGMVSLGYETDNEIIHNWVDYLEEKGFIDFAGEWRNGSVQYVVDVNGNTFCEIIVGLEDEETFYGEVDVEWNAFPSRRPTSKRKLTRVR